MRGVLLGSLTAVFVAYGLIAVGDGLFADLSFRQAILRSCLLVMAAWYVRRVLATASAADTDASRTVFPTIGAAALMLLADPGEDSPIRWYFWIPYLALALSAAFASLSYGWGPRGRRTGTQAGVIAIWVTFGGLYALGRVFRLPYADALTGSVLVSGITDVRALILVSVVLPAAVQAARSVTGVPQAIGTSTRSRRAVATGGTKALDGLVRPFRLLAGLLLRVIRYIGAVVIGWSRAFAGEMARMLFDSNIYKTSGRVLLMFGSSVLVVHVTSVLTPVLERYLRSNAPWSSGHIGEIYGLFWIAMATMGLLLISLLIVVVFDGKRNERVVAESAELVAWGVVAAACSSVLLWLGGRVPALGIVGFLSPGPIPALMAVIVVGYLIRQLAAEF